MGFSFSNRYKLHGLGDPSALVSSLPLVVAGGAVITGMREALHSGWADYIGYTDVDISTNLRQTRDLINVLVRGDEIKEGFEWVFNTLLSNPTKIKEDYFAVIAPNISARSAITSAEIFSLMS